MQSTPKQRDEAIALAINIGPAEAARSLGLNPNTVRSWVSRAGVSVNPGVMVKATETRLATVAERKAKLADDLLHDAQRLRAQLFAPCVERKAMTVSEGAAFGSRIEVAEVKHKQPPFADQRQIMTSIAIAVDKVQILTGEATQRIEQLTGSVEPAERRQRATEAIDELAARRTA